LNDLAVGTAETRHGRMRFLEADDPIGVSLREYGEWAQAELDLLCRLVKPGDVVLDVGASVGTHALALAAAVGPAGKVVALEPQPAIRALLEANVASAGLAGRVDVLPFAAAEAHGTAHLSVPDYGGRHNSGTASLLPGEGRQVVEVQTARLDALGLERCALVKLDIEGAEEQALGGATGLLEAQRPLVYAECNSVERGWRVMSLAGPGYHAWLHAPPAFNPSNHRGNPRNLFGEAHETNLLLVPAEREPGLREALAATPALQRVNSLDDLAGGFSRALRYGESEARPEAAPALARQVRALERALRERPAASTGAGEDRPTARRRGFTRPLHVLVPVYNGFTVFEQLARSLFRAYPEQDPMLRFVFIDDASPDPAVRQFLASALFDRPDVIRLENTTNRGFIGTVNRGIERFALGADGTDLVILNADTLVSGRPLELLQEAAYRLPNVASVTPLTNNGTIASLLNWPEGGDLPSLLDPELVSAAVEQAGHRAPPVDLPTGVGFCMYMTRAAVEVVGGFDPVFGKGYGEENHWCLTAASRGFVNLLCTEAFVYHHGSQSFGDEVRRQHLEKNLALLGSFHPSYARDVDAFVQKDPLRHARSQVAWAVRAWARQQYGLRTVLYVLHTEPRYHAGGTERHVMGLTRSLLQEGRSEVWHLFPEAPGGQWILRCYLPRSVDAPGDEPEFLTLRYEPDQLLELLSAVGAEVDVLHVQHGLNAPAWMRQAPGLFPRARKLLTLHDYHAACPTIRAMAGGQHCGIPESPAECNRCLREKLSLGHLRIEEYRRANAAWMQQFDRVLTPSEASRRVLERAFAAVPAPGTGTLAPVVAAKIQAVPNFLPGELEPSRQAPAPRPASHKRRVVFLGAFSDFKGAELFAEAVPEMRARGWTPEVWGTLGRDLPQGVVHRGYRGSGELRELALAFPVDVVAVPSVWPETFSFTTWEAVLDVGAPVVVGPTGNPPEVVKAYGVGHALEALTAGALVSALQQVLDLREQYSAGFAGLFEAARLLTVDAYREALYGPAAPGAPAPAGTLPLPASPRSPPSAESRPPLRYALVDATNAFIKNSTPMLYAYGKQLGAWASRLRK
jgi:FkbM family methyltransferase